MKKYRMTSESKTLPCGTTVYRIEAVEDIPFWKVKKGDAGGFIEMESNLVNSDKDNCWVAGDAVVMGEEARLVGTVRLKETAIVSGDSIIEGGISIYGDAKLEDVKLKGWSINIWGNARLSDVILEGNCISISDNANLSYVRTQAELNDSRITGNVLIDGSEPLLLNGTEIVIEENVQILGGGTICGRNIFLTDDVVLDSGVSLEGRNIRLEGAVHLGGDVRLGDNCHLRDCVSLVENTVSFDPVLKDLELGGDLQIHVGEVYALQQQ